MRTLQFRFALLLLLAVAGPSQASVVEIFDPGDLNQDGAVTWPGNDLEFLPNPFITSITGVPTIDLLVSSAGAVLLRRTAGSSWISATLPGGLPLVWSDDSPGPVTLAFGGNIRGVGFYLEAESVADTTFSITALNDSLSVIATATEFRSNGDGFFWGLLSDQTDIRTIEITSSFDPDIVFGGMIVQVPEPGSVMLMAVGMWVLVMRGRRGAEFRMLTPDSCLPHLTSSLLVKPARMNLRSRKIPAV